MKEFIKPEFEVVSFNNDDIIATSGCGAYLVCEGQHKDPLLY